MADFREIRRGFPREDSLSELPSTFDVEPRSDRDGSQPSPTALLPPGGKAFLNSLLRLQMISGASAKEFLHRNLGSLSRYLTAEILGADLVQAKLLTAYQLKRLLSGHTHGMILGNYRVLERLGSGAMGEVFLAEHIFMRRRAAVKVLPVDDDCSAQILERFYSEIQVLADLQHPNIVAAYDAGKLVRPHPGMPDILYLVMEYVSGGDLHRFLSQNGPAPVAQACRWISQASQGLQEAHDHHLVHRDIKPSNLLLTQKQHVKLVDFGLVRQFSSRLTDPHSLLGTIEFMAPEQSQDPSAVSIQSDIYGLGATMFFLLTGEAPFPHVRTLTEALRQLCNGRPRLLRQLRPDAPTELERLLDWMLHRDPTLRPSMPLTVKDALVPFLSDPR